MNSRVLVCGAGGSCRRYRNAPHLSRLSFRGCAKTASMSGNKDRMPFTLSNPLSAHRVDVLATLRREIGTVESLRGRLTRGAMWSFGGAVVSQAAAVIAAIVAARILGRDGFGQYGMIQNTVGMLGIFAGLGLGVTLTKYVAKYRDKDRHRAGGIIMLGSSVAAISGGVLTIGLLIGAPILATRTLMAPRLTDALRIASILLFLNAINGAQIGALAGFEAFRSIAKINCARGIVAVSTVVVGVRLWGLAGAIWGVAVSAGITCILSHLTVQRQCANRDIRLRWRAAAREIGVLWTFAAPAFLGGALVGPVTWAASAMLVNEKGGYAEMGTFSAATQWKYAIAFVPGIVAQFALPVLSSLSSASDSHRLTKTLKWNLVVSVAAALLIAVPVALGAPYIMAFYGRSFRQGGPVLVISAVTAVIACANDVIGTAILSVGSAWVGLVFNSMWASVLLVACHYLIPTHLALGLAASMLAAYVAHTTWQAVYLRRFLAYS